MTITVKDRVINRLMTAIRMDPDDPEVVRVDLMSVFHTLGEYDVYVPPVQFENNLSQILEEKVVGKLPADVHLAKMTVAEVIWQLSSMMHITKKGLAISQASLDRRKR